MRTALILFTVASMVFAMASSGAHGQDSQKRGLPLSPPLPFGRTGPLPQMPLDLLSPVSPEVSYHNGELSIVAPNSSFSEILSCVRAKTGAEIEIPASNERVVTHLGPGPVRDVLAQLLNGSPFNYVLVGSPTEPNSLTRVVLSVRMAPGVSASVHPGAMPRVPPIQETIHATHDANTSVNQQAIANQDQMPSPLEVTPPSEGAFEMTD